MYLLAEIEVCYGKYGCFSNREPFKRIASLPFPPAMIAPKFRLYTRFNPDKPQFIDDFDLSKLQNSSYSGSKRTVIVVHGYIGKLENLYMGRKLVRFYCSYVHMDSHPKSEFPGRYNSSCFLHVCSKTIAERGCIHIQLFRERLSYKIGKSERDNI